MLTFYFVLYVGRMKDDDIIFCCTVGEGDGCQFLYSDRGGGVLERRVRRQASGQADRRTD